MTDQPYIDPNYLGSDGLPLYVADGYRLFPGELLNAIIWSIANPQRPVLNITQLALGGVVLDWSTYILDAVAAVSTVGSAYYGHTIYFPGGTYPVKETMTITSEVGLDFLLAHEAKVVADATLEGKIFRFIDSPKVSFNGGVIDASAMGNPAPGEAWDSLSFESNVSQTDDITVQNVTFYHGTGSPAGNGGGDSSIFAAWTTRCRIINCLFIGSHDVAIYLSGNGVTADTSYDFIVTGNFFFGCYSGCEAKRTAGNVIFANNVLRNCGEGGGFATSPGTNPGTDAQLPGKRVLVANNQFIDTLNDAISVRGFGDHIVEGNRIEGFTDTTTFVQRGIVVAGSTANKIRNNTIIGSGTGHTNQRGIFLCDYVLNTVTYHSTDNDIAGNTIKNFEKGIIEDTSDQTGNVYDGNTLFDCTTDYTLASATSYVNGVRFPWTPDPRSLVTSGTVNISGTYVRQGAMVTFTIELQGDMGGTSTSTANTTHFAGLPFPPADYGTCVAVDVNNTASLGVGMVFPEATPGAGSPYVPTWATKGYVVVTGSYPVD